MTSLAHPTNDVASRQAALQAATAALQAFLQPQLPPAQWWVAVSPLLSPTAGQAYKGTDPSTIPAHRITGAARLAGTSTTPYLSRVAVPTDIGPYLVLLSRAGAGQPWLVERFTPPAGYGG